MRFLWALFLLLANLSSLQAQATPFDAQLKNDRISLQIYRSHLSAILDYLKTQPYKNDKMLSADQKEDLRGSWRSFLDNIRALDSVGNYYASIRSTPNNGNFEKALQTADWVFLTEYRYALELLKVLDGIPGIDVFLNEADESKGLAGNTLSEIKFRFLNVQRATEFLAKDMRLGNLGNFDPGAQQTRQIKEDRKVILAMGLAPGPILTVKNGIHILTQTGFETCFPVQKGVSEWMGKTKVYRPGQCLISTDQAAALKQKLEPGDMIFSRHEWYMSNVGLPGFWCHAALYMGDAVSRKAYFDDPKVRAWVRSQEVKGSLEDLLRSKFRAKYSASLRSNAKGQVPRVIEAVGEGVVFSSLGRFAEADSLCALRPRLSKLEKAIALYRAFRYVGRPYDFNFDFQSDDALVCSELVYKAYEPSKGLKGLLFPLQEMLGRTVTSPNSMVEQFDDQYGKPSQQTDLVIFLDGHEREKAAVESDLKEFRESWKRPKWHVLVQK